LLKVLIARSALKLEVRSSIRIEATGVEIQFYVRGCIKHILINQNL